MKASSTEKIGRNIKEKISQLGLSVHALEKKAGLKQSAVQNILYGKSKKPSIHLIQSIATVLNCTVSELLGEDIAGVLEREKAPIHTGKWDADLYINTLNTVNTLSQKKNISLARDRFFACAEEVYSYSLKTNKAQPDKDFADWLIDKSST